MGTELDADALPGTSGKHRSRLYQKTNKWSAGTELEDYALPGTSGNPRSRPRAGAALEAIALAGTSGDRRSRLYYQKTDKADNFCAACPISANVPVLG